MASRAAWINVGGTDAVGAASITAVDDTITITAHGLSNGDLIAFDTLSAGVDGPLVDGAVYFVRDATTDTFRVSGSRGGERVTFDADGTANATTAVPAYTAEELRQLASHLHFHGAAQRLGAREGVRPGGGDPVTVAGTTWNVQTHTGTVNPARVSTQAPYDYVLLAQTGNLDPADGSNARIDAIDAQIVDPDVNGSGVRGVRPVYVAGDPAGTPVEPTLSDDAFRLATIDVPAGGSPTPSIRALGQWTVASGGVLPVRDDTELPVDGLYDMMLVGDQSTGQFKAQFGGTWQVAAVVGGYQLLDRIVYDTSGDFVKDDYPGGSAVYVEIGGAGGGGGGCSTTTSGQSSAGAGGGAGQTRRGWIDWASLAATETVTIGAGGSGGANGTSNPTAGGSSSFGSHITAAGGNAGESDDTAGTGFSIHSGGSASNSSGSGGDEVIPGSAGKNGIHGDGLVLQQGDGGSSFFSGSGRCSSTNGGSNGPDAPGPGAGGSSGYNVDAASSRTGGDGGNGKAVVWVWG